LQVFAQPPHPYNATKFSGYRLSGRQAHFFWTGHTPQGDKDAWKVETQLGEGPWQTTPMQWNPKLKQWEAQGSVFIGQKSELKYRYIQSDGFSRTIHYDLAEKKEIPGIGMYNTIAPQAKDPQSNGANLLIFPDSLLPTLALDEKIRSGQGKRNHFNVFGGGLNEDTQPIINKLIDKYGFQMTESRPVIGGSPLPEWDRTGAHGYWTSNLFQRSPRLRSEENFKDLALSHLQSGTKLCFDAAFVGMGLNSIYYLSNLRHTFNSPFLKRFEYNPLQQFPYEPIKLGILPTRKDATTGDDVINDKAWDIRFIPPKVDPDEPQSTWHIELYDPRIEDKLGNKLPNPPLITSSQDSVHNYRFPVKASVVKAKMRELQDARGDSEKQKQLKRFWPGFQLDSSALDNSAAKWDGQRDQVKLKASHRVVQYDIMKALEYWTDKVNRIYVYKVARALEHIRRQNPDLSWEESLNELYNPQKNPIFLLPKPTKPHGPELKNNELQRVLQAHTEGLRDSVQSPPKNFVTAIRNFFNLESLPGTPNLQILFATPSFKKILYEGDRPAVMRGIQRLISPYAKLTSLFFPDDFQPTKAIAQESFMNVVEKKLQQALINLPQNVSETLCDPDTTRLFHENISKSIFLSVLTGKTVKPHEVQALAYETTVNWMEKNIPSFIQNAPPKQAARLLASWMKGELQKMDIRKLNLSEYLDMKAARISSDSVAVSEHYLNTQGLGLHWRIDAMKDIANIDKILSLPDIIKTRAMKKEAEFIANTFDEYVNAIRKVFKKSIIRPEISKLHEVVGPNGNSAAQNEQIILRSLLGKNRFDGITNFQYMSDYYRLLYGAGRVDEGTGNVQLTPSEYIQQSLKPMMTTLPLHNVFQYQNILSNQDFSTSVYWLTLHPITARTDHMHWLGLLGQDGFVWEALNELHHKKQLGLDPGLNFDQIQNVKKAFEQVLLNPEDYPEDIQAFIEHSDKRPRHFKRPVPDEIKKRFMDEFFSRNTQHKFGLTGSQYKTLQKNLTNLLLEPSEVKAVRGKLTNAFESLSNNPAHLVTHGIKSEAEAQAILKKLAPYFNQSTWSMVQSFPEKQRRWLGYQQFDFFIDNVFKHLPLDALPENHQQQEQVKQALYTEMIRPALEQYKRMAALVCALPGDPTFYMPDLYAQAGGEHDKNMFIGNRELIRLDWRQKNPVIKAYQDDLAKIIRERKENPVLNNGHLVLPLDPEQSEEITQKLNDTGVLPLIRDDGQGQQVISLINTGKPEEPWTTWRNALESSKYPEVGIQQPRVEDYKLDLSHIKLPKGSQYQSVNPDTGKTETFFINDSWQLVRTDAPEKGIDIGIHRLLKRLPEEAYVPLATLPIKSEAPQKA
jgi:hypothetical protein